ncbi:response regulator transcription factor [Marinomonas profundimaris]|jgi:DNA-binding CsgD family transcriptional regulator|uniref:LuxR family transcriptional regulator n=1 Tax=Marinomonas profundimaris TaxID=1208321 RepID=W1S152_9GAMM|nr:helix-turn-helix transcriptional regulator [Marinomonas profundimaris]ETI61739.1 LuxR family transcriptional regulator [Marinomonas profundimaris]
MLPSKATSDGISAETLKELVTLVNHLRVPSFPTVLERFLRGLCHFDTIIMVTYKKSFKPIIIHPKDRSEHSSTLNLYLNTAYMLDPLFNGILMGTVPGISRLIDIAPDSFKETEYYLTCYRKFDLVDEINLTIPLDDKTTCAISLGRKTHMGSIKRSEMTKLREIFPLLEALIKQFWLTQSRGYVDYQPSNGPIKHALKTFASGVLTHREQEVLGLILRGHSSKAIAEELGISAGTVKVHRKNIHARLDTSTQSEIFTLFLDHLEELDQAKTAVEEES